jgi:hypothetical protein
MMNSLRRLVYDFFELPYHIKIDIGIELGLIKNVLPIDKEKENIKNIFIGLGKKKMYNEFRLKIDKERERIGRIVK